MAGGLRKIPGIGAMPIMAMAMVTATVTAAAMAMLGMAAASPAVAASPKVGAPAPEFHATTLDGERISLEDFRGQVLVINFWATWCGPCKRELPLLDGFLAVNKHHGLRVIAVTTENSAPVRYLKPLQKVLHFPLARNFRGGYAPIGGAVPTNFVIDRAGRVRFAAAGAFDLDQLNALLIPLLREPAPPTLAVGG